MASAVGAIKPDKPYFLLVKIMRSAEGGAGGRVKMAAYDAPGDIPNDKSGVAWLLDADFGMDGGSVDPLSAITLAGGAEVDWRVDAVRIASAFEGAVVTNGLSGVMGDINQDGVLNEFDVDAFAAGWGTIGHSTIADLYSHGDLNLDGVTDLKDVFEFHSILSSRGMTVATARLLPEPRATGLVILGAFLLHHRANALPR